MNETVNNNKENPSILAIDTSAAALTVALSARGKTAFFREENFRKTGEILLSRIDSILSEAGLKINDLDALCAAVGPGSFTGIRIGVTTVRTLSQALGLRVIPVTNTQILAYNYTGGRDASDTSIVAVSDAANGFLYTAVYDSLFTEIMPPSVMRDHEFGLFIDSIDEPCRICAEPEIYERVGGILTAANGAAKDCPMRAEKNNGARFSIFSAAKNGDALIKAALESYRRNNLFSYDEIVPLYIRRPQAELDLERKGGK